MAILMKADGTVETRSPKNGRNFDLDEMQLAVGGYIEFVYLNDGNVLVVNEEGKLRGLDLNMSATDMAAPTLGPTDCIVGDALCCTPIEAGIPGDDEWDDEDEEN